MCGRQDEEDSGDEQDPVDTNDKEYYDRLMVNIQNKGEGIKLLVTYEHFSITFMKQTITNLVYKKNKKQ